MLSLWCLLNVGFDVEFVMLNVGFDVDFVVFVECRF